MRRVMLPILLSAVLGAPTSAHAVTVSLSDGVDIVEPPANPGVVLLPDRVGVFTIQQCDGCAGLARVEFEAIVGGGRLNRLTLTDAFITNTSLDPATLTATFAETGNVETELARFYGLTLSGFFTRFDPFVGGDSLAFGDAITLGGFVTYFFSTLAREETVGDTGYEVGGQDPFDLGPNFFAPPNPPQPINSFTCGAVCDDVELVRGILQITLGPGDSLTLPGSASIIAAATEAFLAQGLALDGATGQVPGPGALILVSAGLAAFALRRRRPLGRGPRPREEASPDR